MRRSIVSLGVLAAAGCGAPTVDLFTTTAATTTVPATFDDRDWATVLRENVKDGLVDYDHLFEHAEPLDRFLGTLAVVGPQRTPNLFPSRTARLAYYLNAYNAGVLKAVLHEQIPPTMHDVRRPSLEHGYRLMLDGRPYTLAEVREAARAESLGDARIEFCLCDAAKGSPPLRQQPFRAAMMDDQLGQAGREAMDNPQMVNIDHEKELLNVSLVIRLRREQFRDFYRRQTGVRAPTLSNVLLHLASGMRRQWLTTAVGYAEAVIPFDRALNRWRAGRPAQP
ncbi:MAG: DUF547 domain-containing protein [Planctomycetota bacterium]|jgi:hypothetical protein